MPSTFWSILGTVFLIVAAYLLGVERGGKG